METLIDPIFVHVAQLTEAAATTKTTITVGIEPSNDAKTFREKIFGNTTNIQQNSSQDGIYNKVFHPKRPTKTKDNLHKHGSVNTYTQREKNILTERCMLTSLH